MTTLPLEECMSAIIDYRGKTPRKTLAGVPLITAKVVKGGRIETPDEFIDSAEYDEWMRRGLPQVGDVVLTTEAPLGEVAQLSESRIALAQRLILLRGKPELLNNTYLKYLLMSKEIQGQLVSRASGTTVVGIKQSELRKVSLSLPPIAEQESIAAVLGSLDDKIEQNRRTGAKLEGLARAVFKAWFVDFEPVKAKAAGATAFPGMPAETFAALPTRFEDSELGPLPAGWEVKALRSLCTVGRGSSPRPINNFMGGTIPWLKIADATASTGPFIYKTKEFVTESGATKSVAVVPGDLILSNSASCGIPTFVGLHGCIHDGWLHFRNLQQISKGFLYHFMQWKSEHLVHIADGSVQKNLNTKLINDLQLIVPPTQTHDAFAELNDLVFLQIDALGRESAKLAELRDYLLPRLLSGRVRVRPV